MTTGPIDAQALLAQMRAMATQARGTELKPADGVGPGSFTALMREAIQNVNANQQRAAQLSESFERGAPGVELTDVMVSIQKASLSFQAATQVRNRLVSAYQDIMNMPL